VRNDFATPDREYRRAVLDRRPLEKPKALTASPEVGIVPREKLNVAIVASYDVYENIWLSRPCYEIRTGKYL
jgi:hypothetical protein